MQVEKLVALGVTPDMENEEHVGNLVYTPLILDEKHTDIDLSEVCKVLGHSNHELTANKLGDSIELLAVTHIYFYTKYYMLYHAVQVVFAAMLVYVLLYKVDYEALLCLATSAWHTATSKARSSA